MPCVDMIGTGKNIEKICKTHGITMKQMADKIGVSSVAVSKWKNAKTMPTIDNIVAIAGIFGVKFEDIISVTNR